MWPEHVRQPSEAAALVTVGAKGRGQMIRALLILGLAAFFAGAPAHAQAPAPRVALVIGNAAYTSAPGIATAAADATIVAETMRTAGYDVTELHDVVAANFGQTLRAF